ncbi:MAG: hypothetical protein HQL15_00445 [Candidatus Omnitrophica bacterium]|nr:hypothetical protein [Candidatus Omnitrophota bacterium]
MKVFTFNSNLGIQKIQPTWIDQWAKALLLLLAIAFVLSVVYLGMDKVSSIVLPYVIPSAQGAMLLFFLCIYPLSKFNPARPFLVIPSLVLSYFLGACSWVYSLLFIMNALGFWGFFFCFLFQTLTPITIIGAIFKGAWGVVGNLALWLIVSTIIKFFSAKLNVDFVREEKDSKIIDIEASPKD